MKRSQSIKSTGLVLGTLFIAGAAHAETLSLDLVTVAQFNSTTKPTS